MKYYVLFPLCLVVFFLSCDAQKEYLIQTKIKPNKTYSKTIEETIEATLNFSGNEEKLAEIRSSGVSLPYTTVSKDQIKTKLTTGDRLEHNAIEADKAIIIFEKNVDFMGETHKQVNPLTGMHVFGSINPQNYRMKVDSFTGSTIPQKLKLSVERRINEAQKGIQFPSQTIALGENLQMEIPISIPMVGMRPIEMNRQILMILKEVKDEKAYFDVSEVIHMNSEQNGNHVTAVGAGNGKAIFDLVETCFIEYNTTIPFDITVNFEKDDIIGEMNVNLIATESTEVK